MKRLLLTLLGLTVLALPGLAYAERALTATVELSSTPPADGIYGPGVVEGKARLYYNAGAYT